ETKIEEKVVEETTLPEVATVNSSKNESNVEGTTVAVKEEKVEDTQTAESVVSENSTPATQPKAESQPVFYDDEFEAAQVFAEDLVFMWPVEGEIAMDFSTDKAVYDPTLEQFRTNDTVCILADEGTSVAVAADGVVKSVFNDYEKGYTVVVEHNNGWSTTYSQLMEKPAVEEGDNVEKGNKIGEVGTPTKYGYAIGSHLEFKITQGDIAIDPKVAINE
ncbi:MAG: peptidoglycan DD-metalloendopeptidase family protein, partial [Anaerotignaceae bacterium]